MPLTSHIHAAVACGSSAQGDTRMTSAPTADRQLAGTPKRAGNTDYRVIKMRAMVQMLPRPAISFLGFSVGTIQLRINSFLLDNFTNILILNSVEHAVSRSLDIR